MLFIAIFHFLKKDTTNLSRRNYFLEVIHLKRDKKTGQAIWWPCGNVK